METVIEELKALVLRHAREDYTPTGVDRIEVVRGSAVTEIMGGMVIPRLCLTLQGAKCIRVGSEGMHYDAGKYFVSTVEVPVVGQVAEASAEAPYLGVSLTFDPATIASVLLDMPPVEDPEFVCGFGISPAEPELMDAFLRMLRLIDRPAEIPVLAPMIEREILFRLLQGPAGVKLRQIARADSRQSQMRRVLAYMREHYTKPFMVEDLARMAGMSVSVFHRHFKIMTLLTPIQYQKQYRLFEARKLLLSRPGDTAGVAFAVGYESASQFSREYARFFGITPARDGRALRADARRPEPVQE